MKKGQEYNCKIVDYAFPAKGIGIVTEEDGSEHRVEVKNAFPEQEVRIRITKKKGEKIEGQVLEVLKASPKQTRTPDCPHFGPCGGCLYQEFPYEEQLRMKEKQVYDLVQGVVRGDFVWEGILGSPVQQGYRNKMEFSFGDEEKDGPLSLGLHKKGSFYDVLCLEECTIAGADAGEILRVTLEHFSELGVPYYKKMSHRGVLRHLVFRQTAKSKELLINLVVSSQTKDCEARNVSAEDAIPEIAEELQLDAWVEKVKNCNLSGTMAGILLTVNDSLADVVQADAMKLLYGKDYITEELLGLQFKITPFSFFQNNTLGAEILYGKAREYVGETKDRVVFDLYSGTGTIAQMLAPVAKEVVGVEIVEEAVVAARENAKANGLDNCTFLAGDVLKVIDEIRSKPDVIVLDPPRDGVHPKALSKIIRYGVDRMIYIACKPTSLARDLVTLQAEGYRVERACCVDLFPETPHVEACCLLTKTSAAQSEFTAAAVPASAKHESGTTSDFLERVSNRKADSYVKLNVKMEDYYRNKDAEKKTDE